MLWGHKNTLLFLSEPGARANGTSEQAQTTIVRCEGKSNLKCGNNTHAVVTICIPQLKSPRQALKSVQLCKTVVQRLPTILKLQIPEEENDKILKIIKSLNVQAN